jgi:hypothetical protein
MDKKSLAERLFIRVFVPGIFLLFVLACAASVYFYLQLQDLKTNPAVASQDEAEKIIAKVGELIVLPENEEPTVATVSDPKALQDQTFFANAKEGDRVLLYTNAKKAILYDPVAHKIVEVAPINIGDNAPQTPGVAGATDEQSGAPIQ